MSFQCSWNPLTSLDVSRYPELIFLYCSDTQITVLDVSNNPRLYYLSCSDNQFTASALNDLFRSLPDRIATGITGYIYYDGNSGESDCDVGIAREKGWSSSHPVKRLEENYHEEMYLNYLKLISNNKISKYHEK
jgi:Leucine-rich repeat (LRR) protein